MDNAEGRCGRQTCVAMMSVIVIRRCDRSAAVLLVVGDAADCVSRSTAASATSSGDSVPGNEVERSLEVAVAAVAVAAVVIA